MDKQVDQFIRSCQPCQLVGPRSKPEPIQSSTIPKRPWINIAIDLLEIPGRYHLVVAVDTYLRWPKVILLRKTDAAHVTRAMEGRFQMHGLPVTVQIDNRPPCPLAQFKGFPDFLAITH